MAKYYYIWTAVFLGLALVGSPRMFQGEGAKKGALAVGLVACGIAYTWSEWRHDSSRSGRQG